MNKIFGKYTVIVILLFVLLMGLFVFKSTHIGKKDRTFAYPLHRYGELQDEVKAVYAEHFSDLYQEVAQNQDDPFIYDWIVDSMKFDFETRNIYEESADSLKLRLDTVKQELAAPLKILGNTPNQRMKDELIDIKLKTYDIAKNTVVDLINHVNQIAVMSEIYDMKYKEDETLIGQEFMKGVKYAMEATHNIRKEKLDFVASMYEMATIASLGIKEDNIKTIFDESFHAYLQHAYDYDEQTKTLYLKNPFSDGIFMIQNSMAFLINSNNTDYDDLYSRLVMKLNDNTLNYVVIDKGKIFPDDITYRDIERFDLEGIEDL